MSITITQKYLTEKQVSALTGLGAATLAKGRSWGTLKLPFIRVGRSVRYALEDVEAFMAARRVDPTAGQTDKVGQ